MTTSSEHATSSPAKTDSTVQRRIINHMNSSHRASLSLFLQHYCHLPAAGLSHRSASRSSGTPTLASISTSHQIILHPTKPTTGAGKRAGQGQGQAKRYLVPFKPPMTTLSETRSRMKSMHEDCLQALDLSDLILTSYIPPQKAGERAIFITLLLVMLVFSRAGNLTPGSYAYAMLGLRYVPRFANFCAVIQPYLITALLALHLAEAVWMARSRLRRHQVPTGGWLWWQWVGSCLVEGVSAFWRFDAWAGEVEGKRESENKH